MVLRAARGLSAGLIVSLAAKIVQVEYNAKYLANRVQKSLLIFAEALQIFSIFF